MKTKKLLSVLLACVMMFTLLPALSAFAEDAPEIVQSGYCGGEGDGTNLSWTLFSDGVLTVTGEGSMGSGSVLISREAKKLVVAEGVTSVGPYAFWDCYELSEVELPHSIVTVGACAFKYCSMLKTIRYEGSENEWDAIVFGEEWYQDSENLYTVVFADGTHRCGAWDSKEENYVPALCGNPGSYEAVWFCPICGIETKRVEKTLNVQPHVWDAWTILAYPTDTGEGLMERHCLYDDSHTETAEIPAGAFGAHEVLRGYCGGEGDGRNLIWSLSDDDVLTVSGTGKMRDYDRYVDFGDRHDYDWSSDGTNTETLGPSVPWVPYGGDVDLYFLASCGIVTPEDQMEAILNGTMLVTDIADLIEAYNAREYTVVIGEGVTYVGANAFRYQNVTSVSLPSTLSWIGQFAFSGISCESLVLPEGVRWVDPYAFYNGYYSQVTIPSTMEIMGSYAIASAYRSEQYLRDITVLCADEHLDSVISGIDVIYLPERFAQGNHEDYRDMLFLEELASDYYFVSHRTDSASEDYSEIEAVLGRSLTEEEIYHLSEFEKWNFCFDYNEKYGVDVKTVDEALAFIVSAFNETLGADFSEEDLFVLNPQGKKNELTVGDIWLTPAADAVYQARFGCSFTDLFFHLGGDMGLKQLKEGYADYVPAQWITLRGRCGSALESEYGALLPFEAVEHDPVGGDVIAPSTCATPGEGSVTCPVCRLTFTGPLPLDEHIPGEPVRENETAASCAAAGGYDEVVCCTVCENELSRTHVTVDPIGHANARTVAATEATETEHGYTEGVYCPDCDAWLSGHEVIHNHLGEQFLIQKATDTEDGLVDIVCTVCGERIRYTASTTEPKPDEDTDDGGIAGFWMRITTFFKGIIDWFLRLFRKP